MIIHVVVPAARAPSASHAMAPGATLAPVTTTSTAARTRERGVGAEGRTRYMNGQEVPCPPRALKGSHSRSFTANQKLPLNGSVLAVSCSSQALCTSSNKACPIWARRLRDSHPSRSMAGLGPNVGAGCGHPFDFPQGLPRGAPGQPGKHDVIGAVAIDDEN